LRVRNYGARAVFRATFEIVECSVSAKQTAGNVGLWNDGCDRVDIFTGADELLHIGVIDYWPGRAMWKLLALVGSKPKAIVDYIYAPQIGGNAAPHAEIIVAIFSDPSLPSGPWVGRYRFDSEGLSQIA
jgi:hypothetical protein